MTAHPQTASVAAKLTESSPLPDVTRFHRMPESARRLTLFLARQRLGSDTTADVSERKTSAQSSPLPPKKGTRPPYCSSTANARNEASVVKLEKTSKTSLYLSVGGAAER